MKLFTLVACVLALLAGVAGGLRAYSVSAATPPAPPLPVVVHHAKPQPVRPGVVVRWAPCVKPAVREGRACVTHVVHTVVVPAPSTALAPASRVAPARAARSHAAAASDDGTRHHGGDDGGGGGGDD